MEVEFPPLFFKLLVSLRPWHMLNERGGGGRCRNLDSVSSPYRTWQKKTPDVEQQNMPEMDPLCLKEQIKHTCIFFKEKKYPGFKISSWSHNWFAILRCSDSSGRVNERLNLSFPSEIRGTTHLKPVSKFCPSIGIKGPYSAVLNTDTPFLNPLIAMGLANP